MNFTRLTFLASLAGTVLMNNFAYAQTPIEQVSKVERDTGKNLMKAWAVDMHQIVDRQFGEARQRALMDRTARLSADLKSLKACATNEDTDFLRSWLVSYRVEEKLPLELNYKPHCDFDRHVIVDGEVAIASFHADLNVDDAFYSQANATKDLIARWIPDWAAEEKKALDEKDPAARRNKVAEIARNYRAKFQNTPCHQNVSLNFWKSATDAVRTLPIKVTANELCQGHRLQVTFAAELDPVADARAPSLSRPTIDPKKK